MGYRDYSSGQKDLVSHTREWRAENIAFLRSVGTHDTEIERRLGIRLQSEERSVQRKRKVEDES